MGVIHCHKPRAMQSQAMNSAVVLVVLVGADDYTPLVALAEPGAVGVRRLVHGKTTVRVANKSHITETRALELANNNSGGGYAADLRQIVARRRGKGRKSAPGASLGVRKRKHQRA